MPTLRRLLSLATTATIASSAGLLWAASRPRPDLETSAAPDPPPGLPPARIVAVPGHGELFVREAASRLTDPRDGAVPTVVLLHGWMFPADLTWFPVYGPLSEVARVIAVDHRGHGRGSRPSQPFRLRDVADDVAALLRRLGTGPVVAVGYSMGGPVAQLLWRRHPDVVRGLVLCATSGSFNISWRDRWVWRGMGLLQVILRLLPRHWWETLLARQASGRLPLQVSRMITEDVPADILELLPWIVGELDRASAEDVAEAGRELGRYDARDWLGSVDVPTAVLATTRDRLVPLANQRALARGVPGARTYELNLDHNAVIASPQLFAATLTDAVRWVLAAAAETTGLLSCQALLPSGGEGTSARLRRTW
jgi:pimeloyl-ACP methyl ester carboxylesterase